MPLPPAQAPTIRDQMLKTAAPYLEDMSAASRASQAMGEFEAIWAAKTIYSHFGCSQRLLESQRHILTGREPAA